MKKKRKPRKDGIYIVNVSFKEEELNLLEFADAHGSFTSYVKRLILEDKKRTEDKNAIELLLKNNDLIKLLTANKEITATEIEGQEEEANPVDEEALLDFLNQD